MTHLAPVLSVRGLRISFPGGRWTASAPAGGGRRADVVRGVDFDLAPGQALGLVGESGSGKSTIGLATLRLLGADAEVSGRITLVRDGRSVDVLSARGLDVRLVRKSMQIIFQDPGGSLNPRRRIGPMLREPLRVHEPGMPATEIDKKMNSLIERCELPPDSVTRFPHEFSGGQRQRLAIVRALMLDPVILICDEVTSALDVSVQAQILNLLKDLQSSLGLALVFISHDIGVVDHMCDRVMVLRAGEIVESGTRDEVIASPRHEYTRTLIAAATRVGAGA